MGEIVVSADDVLNVGHIDWSNAARHVVGEGLRQQWQALPDHKRPYAMRAGRQFMRSLVESLYDVKSINAYERARRLFNLGYRGADLR